MPAVVASSRPDVVALIQSAADRLTGGSKAEAVAMAMRSLLEQHARKGSLFGAHPGSLWVSEDVDPTAPVLQEPMNAETGHELDSGSDRLRQPTHGSQYGFAACT